MEIVLFQPDIAQNTGNIARTCSVSGTNLTLVRPLGFNMSSRQLKRSGLDYWDTLNLQIIDSLEDYLNSTTSPYYFFSTKADKIYTDIKFNSSSLLIFGSETEGLPIHFHEKYKDLFYTIPMLENRRSLNLSNSCAIVLYEAWRQLRFIKFLKSFS